MFQNRWFAHKPLRLSEESSSIWPEPSRPEITSETTDNLNLQLSMEGLILRRRLWP